MIRDSSRSTGMGLFQTFKSFNRFASFKPFNLGQYRFQ